MTWPIRKTRHDRLDDYPRAPPHIGEPDLDLLSWMGFSRTMREIAEFIGEEGDRLNYASIERAIIQNIDDLLHRSEDSQMY